MALALQTAGMKIIKSFGDGLNLTNAGKLNLTAATANKLGGVKVGDGLSIDDGVLSADNVGTEYATIEFETGEKWLNGQPIKGITFKLKANELHDATVSQSSVKGQIYTDFELSNFEALWIDVSKSFIFLNTRTESPLATPVEYYSTSGYIRANVQQQAAVNNGKITIYFDATYGTGVLSNVSGDNYIVVTLLYVEKAAEE